jgi:hypothetical protein
MKSQRENPAERRATGSILTTTEFMTTARKLLPAQKELADRIESALGVQWVNDAGKWVNRIKKHFGKTERVTAEVESAMKESRIKTTPAQYAEQIWKEFAP